MDRRLTDLVTRHRQSLSADLAAAQALEEALSAGDPGPVRRFVDALTTSRQSEAVRLPELQRSVSRLRAALIPGILVEYAGRPEQAAAAIAGIDDLIDSMLLSLGEAYLASATEELHHLLDEQRKALATLEDSSQRDSLTRLYNHAYFYGQLRSELERSGRYGREVSLILLDLDFFKIWNDRFGHQVGDAVIVEVARAFSASVRQSDTVARYGGEEFAVILPETPWQRGLDVANKLRLACASLRIEAPDGTTFSVTASAGVAGFPEHGADADALVRAADQALYDAKEAGRNRVTVAARAQPAEPAPATTPPVR